MSNLFNCPETATASEPIRAGDLLTFVSGTVMAKPWTVGDTLFAMAGNDAEPGEVVRLVYRAQFRISEVDAVIGGGMVYLQDESEDEDECPS